MQQRDTRLLARADLLATCVLVLVLLGYVLCLAVLVVCPSIVPEPAMWATSGVFEDILDDVFRRSVVNLSYWMLAVVVAVGLGALITVLGGRALRALGELGDHSSDGASSGENR